MLFFRLWPTAEASKFSAGCKSAVVGRCIPSPTARSRADAHVRRQRLSANRRNHDVVVASIIVTTIIVFIIVDILLRVLLKRMRATQLRKEREQALDIGLKLDVSEEAATLTRVELDHPQARILAVDDEKIVLDSLRKMLTLGGYSIDTVESGPEALGLIGKRDAWSDNGTGHMWYLEVDANNSVMSFARGGIRC